MKTRLLILTVLLLTSMTLAAQMPDALSALFGGKFRDNPAATETIIKGEPLKPYSLSRFQSLEIKGDPSGADFCEKAVKESTTPSGMRPSSKEESSTAASTNCPQRSTGAISYISTLSRQAATTSR